MNVVIINRRFYGWNWNAPKTNYHDVIDHTQHQVHYIIDGNSKQGLHEEEYLNADIIELPSLDLSDLIKETVRRLHTQKPVDRIIALNEEDILLASQLRDELNIGGVRETELARFRNKILMKEILQHRKIAVPEFTVANNAQKIVEKFGYPVVLKPLDGASSKGVKIACDENELHADLKDIGDQLPYYEAEQFISGSIFHLDGFMNDLKIVFCQVYQYYNSCYAFANGSPVGVMMVDDEERQQKLNAFAEQALAALELPNGPFHLELFIDTQGEVRFLEVGARVGGAFVAPCIEKRWGISLFEENLKLQMNGFLDIPRLESCQPNNHLYGWLLFPMPAAKHCVVESVEFSKQGLLPGLIEARLPQKADRVDQSGGYIHTGGTFLIEGKSQNDQLELIKDIIERYRITFSKPLETRGAKLDFFGVY